MSTMNAQQIAETLVRQWQRDCQPMADPWDLEELEKRIAAVIETERAAECGDNEHN